MSRLEKTIAARKAKGQKSFVAYLTAGDPDLESTAALVHSLVRGGADIIELGIPFSDPLADGPVNQRAAERALLKGVSLSKILAAVPDIRALCPETPLVVFSYMNPIYAMGFENFAKTAKEAGIDAVLVVDLPPEESVSYRKILNAQGLDTVFLASPTSDQSRLALVDSCSSGFVYYVSRTGVTGAQSQISKSLQRELALVKKTVKKPVMVGFGVSNAAQAKEISAQADGVIIGSAIVKLIEAAKSTADAAQSLEAFAQEIRRGLDS
jgi:tryptophan synthase alpha chain